LLAHNQRTHGIPNDRALQDGDLVKLDVTLEKDGLMADAAETVAVGHASDQALRLIALCGTCLCQGHVSSAAGIPCF